MEYVKTQYANVLKGSPLDIGCIVFDSGKSNKAITESNCVNGCFFSYEASGKYYSTSPLVIDGKVYQAKSNHGKPQSCFIVYKDGRVEMKKINNTSEVNVANIKLLIGGVGICSVDSGFKYDPSSEGFTGVFSDVLRDTHKTLIGYRKSDNAIMLITCKLPHSSSGYDLIDLAKSHSLSYCIALDGGGSTFMRYNGKYLTSGQDGRKVHNIIVMKGTEETKPIQPVEQEKIIIDIGHLDNDSGAVGNGFREVDLNHSIAKHTIKDLERHNIKVIVTTGTLANRVAIEKKEKPKYFVSIHNNAGGGDGMEVISYSPNNLSKNILDSMIADGCNNSRGLKYNKDLYVLKNTSCTACIVECAFVDTKDIEAVDTEIEREKFGKAIAKGILKTLGVEYIEEVIEESKPSTPIWQMEALKVVTQELELDKNYWNEEKINDNITVGEVMSLINKLIKLK